MRWLKIQKLEYIENGMYLYCEIKEFLTCSTFWQAIITEGKESATEACCSAVQLSNFQLWLSSWIARAVVWCRYNIK